ncbi:hypothetical protein ABIA35_000690 [Catenulispora sp. MAP12-49]|uniref:hypothetical protein n=1 Tax=Catenulispora sp. MAP12-49 TaxID=3156302 RepID=UPI0035150E12
MSRLDELDRNSRVALGGAVGLIGVLLLVVGWYLISGEAIAAKQLPYLASASIPGAVLVVCGFLFAISGNTDPDTARRIAELHALLTEAVVDTDGGAAVADASGAEE